MANQDSNTSVPPLRLVHSAPTADGLFGAGTNLPPRLAQPATDFMAELDGSAPRPLDPADMAAEVDAYEKLSALATAWTPPGVGDIDWYLAFQWSDMDFDSARACLDFLDSDFSKQINVEEDWWEWIHRQISVQGHHEDVLNKWSSARTEALFKFFGHPSKDKPLVRHPILKLLPDFVDQVRQQSERQRYAIAALALNTLKRPYVFWTTLRSAPDYHSKPGVLPIPVWQDMKERYAEQLKGVQELWCYFEPDDQSGLGEEEGECFFFRYSAVWVDVNPAGVGTLIASATGYYLPLFNGRHSLGDEGFADVCDMNMAEDIWVAVTKAFLPSEGLQDLGDFHRLVEQEEGLAPGIALTWIHAPGARNRRWHWEKYLEEDFLYNLSDVLREGHSSNYSNPNHHRPPFSDDDTAGEDFNFEAEFEEEPPGPNQAPIRLFIVPVTGDPEPGNPDVDDNRWALSRFEQARHYRDLHADGAHGFYIRTYTPD